MSKKFEDMECEELKHYCPYGLYPVSCVDGFVSMCEGKYCSEAYEKYLEEEEENEK